MRRFTPAGRRVRAPCGDPAQTGILLILNDPLAMKKLCDFLEMRYSGQTMPHLNKSS